MIILLDQDGVLADYNALLLDTFYKRHPEVSPLNETQLENFNTELNFPKEYRSILDAIPLEEGFFLSLPPLPGAIEAVTEMLKLGLDIRFCTSPKKDYTHCAKEKYAWIEYHFGRKVTEKLILTRDKSLVHGSLLIDDKPHIDGTVTPSWEHVLYEQPYNKKVPDKRRLNWNNWKEVLHI